MSAGSLAAIQTNKQPRHTRTRLLVLQSLAQSHSNLVHSLFEIAKSHTVVLRGLALASLE